jgi:hypothetical protein
MRIRRLNTIDPMEGHPLHSGRVALVEFNAIRDLLDGVTVKVDFEFVHPFRMKTGTGHGASDRMANIDHEYRAHLATKDMEIRGIQPDVPVERSGHGAT